MAEKTTDPNAVISRDYEEFLSELAPLLTFVPEGERRALIEGFVRAVMQS